MSFEKVSFEAGEGHELVSLDIFVNEVYNLTKERDYRTLQALSVPEDCAFSEFMSYLKLEALNVCRKKEKRQPFLQDVNKLLQKVKLKMREIQPCDGSF